MNFLQKLKDMTSAAAGAAASGTSTASNAARNTAATDPRSGSVPAASNATAPEEAAVGPKNKQRPLICIFFHEVVHDLFSTDSADWSGFGDSTEDYHFCLTQLQVKCFLK